MADIEALAGADLTDMKATLVALLASATLTSLNLVTPALGTPGSGVLTNCTGLPAAGVVGTAAILGANAFTSTQTITPVTEVSPLVLVGGTLAGATSRPLISGTQTWNNAAVTFTGFLLNFTSTASAAASMVMDVQLAGSTLFNVTKAGKVLASPQGSFTGAACVYGLGDAGRGLYTASGSSVGLAGNTIGLLEVDGSTIKVNMPSDATFGWSATSSTTVVGATQDLTFKRPAACKLDISAGTVTNGAQTGIHSLTELTTIAAAASTDTTILMPANAQIIGVSVRVTVALPVTTNFTVGDAGSAARFSTAAVSKAVNSTDPGTKAGNYYNASATAVRITPDSTPSDTTGRVRVTIHYFLITPPTS